MIVARAARLANTPIDSRVLATMARDLVTPGRASARWRAPLRALWLEATHQDEVPEPPPLEHVVPVSAPRKSVRDEALMRLKGDRGGAAEFNAWRRELGMRPLMLAGADLRETDLQGFDLRRCILYGADFRGADLRGCMLQGAVLKDARIAGAQMGGDTLEGHDLDELADAFDTEAIKTFNARHDLSHMVAVTDLGRKRNGRKFLLWRVKLHNNVSQTLRTTVWIENGVHAEMAIEQVLEPRRSHEVALKVSRDKFTREHPLMLTLYVEGVSAPVRQFRAWGWDREWI